MTAHRSISLQDVVEVQQSRPAPVVAGSRSGPVVRSWRVLRRLFDTWAESRAAAATARTLVRLSDRQLRDIGVERHAIPEIARSAALVQLTVAGLDSEPFDPRRIRP